MHCEDRGSADKTLVHMREGEDRIVESFWLEGTLKILKLNC